MSIEPIVPHEMKVVYIQRRKTDFVELNKAIENGDFSFLEKIGHQVKGNAQSFGFDELSPVGIALEKAAKSKDLAQAKTIVKRFGEIVHSIQL